MSPHYFRFESFGRSFEKEIESIDRLCRSRNINRILDLGCGTGEHVNALSRLGFDACGLDSSPDMIAEAKRRFPLSSFEQGDFRKFSTQVPFDLLICLRGSLGYLHDDSSILGFMKSALSSLNPGGLLALEIWNANPILKIGRGRIPSRGFRIGGLDRLREFRLLRKKPAIVELKLEFSASGLAGSKSISDTHNIRIFHLDEIVELSARGGFIVENVYSGISGEDFVSQKKAIVLILRPGQP